MTQVLRALVVDDEPLARERLATLVAEDATLSLIGECGDGYSAVEAILEAKPDLVFLDIQMPEMDGFDVIAAVDDIVTPAVVFVTAYDRYAIRAFEVHAVDYLLKPIDPERFRATLVRARERIASGRVEPVMSHVMTEAGVGRGARAPLTRFAVRSGSVISFVKVDDVDWIEADGNYARLVTAGRSRLVRDTMKSLETRLDGERFVRVHRSVIVNVDRIATLEPYAHGEYVITMRDGTRFTSSRSYGDRIRALIG